MPGSRTVLGNSPEPQIMNDPKSLYQSPSGAQGSEFTQSCSRRRSSREIWRSSTSSRMCCHTGRGRLENRIFGNRVLPEDRADQILTSFAFAPRIVLRHKAAICRIEVMTRRSLGFHTALSEHHQRPTHREVFLPGHAFDLNCQLRRNGHALADG